MSEPLTKETFTAGESLQISQCLPTWLRDKMDRIRLTEIDDLKAEITQVRSEQNEAVRKAREEEQGKFNETFLCPVHHSLEKNGHLEPFSQCVACMRVQRDELLAEIERLTRELGASAGRKT